MCEIVFPNHSSNQSTVALHRRHLCNLILGPLDLFEKVLDHIDMIPSGSHLQNVFLLVVVDTAQEMGIGFLLQQELHDVQVAVETRHKQRPLVQVVHVVYQVFRIFPFVHVLFLVFLQFFKQLSDTLITS